AKTALKTKGWIVLRSDLESHPRSIVERIFLQLHAADRVVADITGRNPNVLFELGYAFGCQKDALLLCERRGRSRRLPFDVHGHQAIFYRNSRVGLGTLARDLDEVLGSGSR